MLRSLLAAAVGVTSALCATSINLIVLGDWGGQPLPPKYSTPAQVATANGMALVAKKINATAIISLGDNFYGDGIQTDETSRRFEHTWEAVYNADTLLLPWYLIAGNHDHYGNITAQIAYSDVSERWIFPSLYYTRSFTSSSASLDIIFIDAIDLSGSSEIQDENDPGYYDPLPFRAKSAASEQWTWIEAQLASSTADHIIVAGHYPVYSVCQHGPTANMLDNLRPLLIQYGAHHFSGHDHCMVSLQDEHDVLYVVSGAGHFCCTNDTHLADVPSDYVKYYISGLLKNDGFRGGFNSVTVTSEGLRSTFWDQDGEELFVTSTFAPRSMEKKQGGKVDASV
jgi:tartrate-resistant acid phosphatase type 5